MAIVTLISDWDDTGYYVAAVKGAILTLVPEVQIVDITHKIPRFDIANAAFVLSNVWHTFPKGTVHIIGVQSEETDDYMHVAVLYKGHYFVGTDNGIFTLIFQDPPDEIVLIDIFYSNPDATTFPARDRFAKVAALLLQGKALSEIGTHKKELLQKSTFKPTSRKSIIHGMVVFIDPFENLITNIPKSLFNKIIGNKPFVISIKKYNENKIVNSYYEVPEGEIACLFSANGFLQIAINRGKASSLLNINIRENVTISVTQDEVN